VHGQHDNGAGSVERYGAPGVPESALAQWATFVPQARRAELPSSNERTRAPVLFL